MRNFQFVLAAALATAVSPAAYAQGLDTGHAKPAVPAAKNKDAGRPAPPAIPGAQSRPETVAPADRSAADLPPTEALFDAINRGDLATSKDALARGADIEGHNLLGLTPLELSVDLGRNDISFLLLSMRGSDGGALRARSAQAATPAPAVKPSRRKPHGAPATDTTDQPDFTTPQSPGIAARASAAPARQAPSLFAGNGGTPQPAAGFLGFDPKH